MSLRYQAFGEPVPRDDSRDLSFRSICVYMMEVYYICVFAFLAAAGMCSVHKINWFVLMLKMNFPF